jgi:hypothetical protein
VVAGALGNDGTVFYKHQLSELIEGGKYDAQDSNDR